MSILPGTFVRGTGVRGTLVRGTMKKLIVYDLDGTLVDTRQDIVNAINFLRKTLGMKKLERKVIESYVGYGLTHMISKVVESDDDAEVERAAKIHRDYYAQHMLDNTMLYPGGLAVLEYFKPRKQIVWTNKPNPFASDILSELGALNYVTEVVAGNSGYAHKPAPDALLAIMKREKVEPGECLMFGDSAIDVESAKNAGVETIVLSHGFTGEDELKSALPHERILSGFPQVLDLARKNQW